MNKKIFSIITFFLFSLFSLQASDLKLSPTFSSYMVVQHDAPFRIYGTAKSGCVVKIWLNDRQQYTTTTNKEDSWSVQLPKLALKKDHTITVISENDTIQLTHVVAGDVWLCSGQSNMEFQIASFPAWAEAEVAAATDPDLRFYSVPNMVDVVPSNDLPDGGSWKQAIGQDLKQCSATAYFFGKNLRKSVEMPIGLICSDWSGTSLEPWMSINGLAPFKQFEKEYNELTSNTKNVTQIQSEFNDLRKTWDKQHYLTGKGIEDKWYLPTTDFSDWQTYKPSAGYWEDQISELENFDGAVWFKTSFDLPENYSGGKFHLFLCYIKDYASVWVNGKKIGETFGDKNWNDYYVAEEILKPKNNILVVRVLNVKGKGGFSFHPFWGTPILNGDWVCKADNSLATDFVVPHIVNVNPFSYPTILYNAMINPIAKNIKIKGVTWYQGESNAGRAYEYRQLLPALINDWRKQFEMPEMPFYLVQLANYEAVDPSGNNNEWAELREAQHLATKLPHVKMATAIDLGEEQDIHPQNKQEVGLRLAQVALGDTYHKKKEVVNPQITGFTVNKNVVSIKFNSKIIIKERASSIKGFSLAGADQKFYKANAEFKNGIITIHSDEVSNPVAIRYAWAKNPGTLNLYGVNGLPLLPYRSDNWKGITDDRVYSPYIIYF